MLYRPLETDVRIENLARKSGLRQNFINLHLSFTSSNGHRPNALNRVCIHDSSNRRWADDNPIRTSILLHSKNHIDHIPQRVEFSTLPCTDISNHRNTRIDGYT